MALVAVFASWRCDVSQSVWHKQDIARIAAGGVVLAPSWDFAAGVAWLAGQLNAPVKLPDRAAVVVIDDAAGREVAR